MGRLRQYYANRYRSSEAVNSEFENVIRYINSAELGNLTLKELLEQLFDANGQIDIGVQFRFDATTGIEARFGDGEEWELIVSADELRGAPGLTLSSVESPIMFNRQDYVATAGQSVFSYVFPEGAVDVLVFVNGLLQAEAGYTLDTALNTMTLATPANLSDKVTIYSMRDNAAASYRRQDFIATENQSVFPFPHGEEEEIVVYRNGVLQREGASYDFISSSDTGTITMIAAQPNNTLITVLVVDNVALRSVVGLMLEERYCTNGFIRYDRVAIADNQIPQTKVNGLATGLASKATIYVSPTTPTGTIVAGSLWINTGTAVPSLLFYDGNQWLDSSPNGLIPLPQATDVLKFLRLNSTATALEFADVDLSGLVAVDEVGNPSGVAPLDGNAKVPNANLPDGALRVPLQYAVSGSVTNGTILLGALYGNVYSFDKLVALTGAGTLTLQLVIGGSNVGPAVAISQAATATPAAWTAALSDASVTARSVAIVVSGATGASDLKLMIPAKIVG